MPAEIGGLGSAARLGRLWRTVRHLRPVQIYGRVRFRLTRPRLDPSPAPGRRQSSGTWLEPAARRTTLLGPTRMCFLNRERDLHEVSWDGPQETRLWRYNQHYFDDLMSERWRERSEWHWNLMAHWIAENPPGRGSGWEPYPTSLRIVNWIKWSLSGGGLSDSAISSLAVQARWLERRLEWHLLGNHLFANAKALIFSGLFFEGAEADRWRTRGLRILESELDEQFLPDGGHFELSPMYHALGLEDLLDIMNVGSAFPESVPASMAADVKKRASAALRWLQTMSHPDGGISFFNDAAFGIAPDTHNLEIYAAALGLDTLNQLRAVEFLKESGYVRVSAGPAVLLADLARIGPDYIPGHAHADTLSFELSLFDERVFVNSGTSEYGLGAERLRQRGTDAHNTVVVADCDSSEVWSGFRVGRRAKPHDVRVESSGGRAVIEASHDGYAHLPGNPHHRRQFVLEANSLAVDDRVTGELPARACFHLHPTVVCHATQDGGHWDLLLPNGQRVEVSSDGAPLVLQPSTWHPEFGRVEKSQRLVLPLRDGKARLRVAWG